MLSIGDKILQNDDYAIKRLYSGVDELSFDIGISDRDIAIITEEAVVKETTYGQTYVIKRLTGAGKPRTCAAFSTLTTGKQRRF